MTETLTPMEEATLRIHALTAAREGVRYYVDHRPPTAEEVINEAQKLYTWLRFGKMPAATEPVMTVKEAERRIAIAVEDAKSAPDTSLWRPDGPTS